jgi:translation initiation factor RLI1
MVNVKELLKKVDEKNEFDEIVELLELKNILDRKLTSFRWRTSKSCNCCNSIKKSKRLFF